MTRSDLASLRDRLNGRDHQVLGDVARFRLLTSRQIQRLHFDRVHPTPAAAARACNRALARLCELHVLKSLQRRIGGIRAGSAGYVWYLGAAGDRLLRLLNPKTERGRRNYREPSRYFVDHTLAIAELAVQTIEVARDGGMEILELRTEPDSWCESLAPAGVVQLLKPDLHLVIASGDYEYHWFVEIDLASEHAPVVLRQCLAYQTFRASGRYQTVHGTFPVVVWVAPDQQRCQQLRGWIAADKRLDHDQFRVLTASDYPAWIRPTGDTTNRGPDDTDQSTG